MNITRQDVKAVGNCLSRDIYDWKVLSYPSLSGHGHISFKLRFSTDNSFKINLVDPRSSCKKVDWNTNQN